ncbi:unnamed protein product [Danaus chrysippus]|uniref:Max-binding protein MNT n=1 Tax=Danaus chrysippus TaxID=151541 RepID=A0A8J2QC45_9NEOP|nr:unnamed protein product [Danaus chrysippus]
MISWYFTATATPPPRTSERVNDAAPSVYRGGARDAVVAETHRGIREALDAARPRPRPRRRRCSRPPRTTGTPPPPPPPRRPPRRPRSLQPLPPRPSPSRLTRGPLTSYRNIPGRDTRTVTGELCSPGSRDDDNSWISSRQRMMMDLPPQIPSPPSVSSSTSVGVPGTGGGAGGGAGVPRAGTREVHNKLEKNRRAHLKECFELLKRQLPAAGDDKKTSNLSILGSAIRYIQVLRRKERECEHEMERLAREKIAAQQRLAGLRRDAAVRGRRLAGPDDDLLAIGIPLNAAAPPPAAPPAPAGPPAPPAGSVRADSPPRSLNLSTKLRPLPIQITPTTSAQVSVEEPGVTSSLNSLVRPAQIHLPLSQVVAGGGLVVGPALQLLPAGLRVLHNGVTTDSNKMTKENGIVTRPPTSSDGVLVSGLGPLVMSPPHTHTHTHVLHTHTLTHKVVEGGVPLAVSAQYLSTAIVKPVVVVSSHEPRRT